MTLRLIGSLTSPYVRRLRLYLGEGSFELDKVNYLDEVDDRRLSGINPLKRIPVLIDRDQVIWESRVIFNYLRRKEGRAPLSIAEENALSAIDTLQDQLVQGFLMKRSGHPVDPDNGYFARHRERERLTKQYLAKELASGLFESWDYPAMSLYSLIDWAVFRELWPREELTGVWLDFYEKTARRAEVSATDPRQA